MLWNWLNYSFFLNSIVNIVSGRSLTPALNLVVVRADVKRANKVFKLGKQKNLYSYFKKKHAQYKK